MGKILTEEQYQENLDIIKMGVKQYIDKDPENEWFYRALYWSVIMQMIADKITEMVNAILNSEPIIELIQSMAQVDSKSYAPITIEDYFNILIDLNSDDQKLLIFNIKGLSYPDKCRILDVLKEKDLEKFKSIIYENKEFGTSIEENTVLARKLIVFRNNPINCNVDEEQFEQLLPNHLLEIIERKFPKMIDFDRTIPHSDDEWKLQIAYIKWNIGIYKYMYNDIFFNDRDFNYAEDIPVEMYIRYEKLKDAVNNMDKRLFNIFKHIPIPTEAAFVTKLFKKNNSDYKRLTSFTKQMKQLAANSKAENIGLKLKHHFKPLFVEEKCDVFDGKTRYEVFISLLEDFLNKNPKPKDYQILARIIYNSKYIIKSNKNDKSFSFKNWYEVFCNACGDGVYKSSYDNQNYPSNEKTEPFKVVFG